MKKELKDFFRNKGRNKEFELIGYRQFKEHLPVKSEFAKYTLKK